MSVIARPLARLYRLRGRSSDNENRACASSRGSKRFRPSKTIGVVIFSFTIVEIDVGKLRPFRRDDQRLGALDRFQRGVLRTFAPAIASTSRAFSIPFGS